MSSVHLRAFVLHTSVAAALTLAGCSGSDLASRTLGDTESGEGAAPSPADDFEAASEATGVPAALLLAVSRAETGLQMVEGEEEFPGQEPAHGVMALRGDNLTRGAALAGLDEDEVRTDRTANIFAAAALLAQWAMQEGIETDDINAWAALVARYSGIEEEDQEARAEYVHFEVYGALADGIELEGVSLPPMDVSPAFPSPSRDQDFRSSAPIWTPSPNQSSRGGAKVDFVVIHTCEGSYSGCWSWLTTSGSGVSAHYVVNSNGSEVRQLVSESNRAWHIGANYSCSNNSGHDCWRNGTNMNSISVGIEHAGYASQSTWNTNLLQRSAQLTCDITKRHNIPRDSYHIVGHGQLQPWNRSDPGANWPWTNYLNRVNSACGGGTSGGGTSGGGSGSSGGSGGSGGSTSAMVIDSNNNANNTSQYYVEVSGNWWASANVSQYYNTGYWVAPTGPVSDPASFWFKSNSAQCYKVDAWWTAAGDRPNNATFIGWDKDGDEVGRKTVDMRYNGGKWVNLGHWNFKSGWNRVLLSRWAQSGKYVIADAVRVTPSSSCP